IDALLDIGGLAQPTASPSGSATIEYPAQFIQSTLERVTLTNACCILIILISSKHTIAPVLHPPGVKEDRATGAGQTDQCEHTPAERWKNHIHAPGEEVKAVGMGKFMGQQGRE